MPTLDLETKYNVKYCIPLWLRDEQIKASCARPNVGRVEAHFDKRSEPCAVVGYGPSLAETWEQIRGFRFVISCSGAHRFLIDRGIVPTWHMAVDPMPGNTVKLIGQPHPAVEYLIASACHPDVLTHLEGYNAKLWHVFDSGEEGLRCLPPGEWAITGGCDVGLRSITMARFFGFTDIHIFGLDGSYGKTGRHAGAHPVPCTASKLEYGGETYETTAAMLSAAKEVFHELDMMPDVRATFYGSGLIQAMSKDYKPAAIPREQAVIAINKPELISAEYKRINIQLHADNLSYGVGGGKHASVVLKLADAVKTRSVLDYGCGKGYLAKSLPFPIWEYDPAVPGKEASPRPADLVICTDVLEHIEPDRLTWVLNDLQRCTRQVGYFVIHTGPSLKSLPDGRNAHLLQRPREWWKKSLKRFFKVGQITQKGPLLFAVVGPLAADNKQMANTVTAS